MILSEIAKVKGVGEVVHREQSEMMAKLEASRGQEAQWREVTKLMSEKEASGRLEQGYTGGTQTCV